MPYRPYPNPARALRQVERHQQEQTPLVVNPLPFDLPPDFFPPERWSVQLGEEQVQAIREFPERLTRAMEGAVFTMAEAAEEMGRRLEALRTDR